MVRIQVCSLAERLNWEWKYAKKSKLDASSLHPNISCDDAPTLKDQP